jgi:hypothetical protein
MSHELQQNARELVLLSVGQAGDGRNGFLEQACHDRIARPRRCGEAVQPGVDNLSFRFQ